MELGRFSNGFLIMSIQLRLILLYTVEFLWIPLLSSYSNQLVTHRSFKTWKVPLGITLRAMPQLRQQCADVGSRMQMQQVYAQQCVQSLGWQMWHLEWAVLPRQLRSCLDSNFLFLFLFCSHENLDSAKIYLACWSDVKIYIYILMTISTFNLDAWIASSITRGEASLCCLPIWGMAQVKCAILKAGSVGSLVKKAIPMQLTVGSLTVFLEKSFFWAFITQAEIFRDLPSRILQSQLCLGHTWPDTNWPPDMAARLTYLRRWWNSLCSCRHRTETRGTLLERSGLTSIWEEGHLKFSLNNRFILTWK